MADGHRDPSRQRLKVLADFWEAQSVYAGNLTQGYMAISVTKLLDGYHVISFVPHHNQASSLYTEYYLHTLKHHTFSS